MIEILLILSFLILIIFLIIIYKEPFILSFVIITLLVFPSDLGTTFRTIIQIADYFLLLYLFFKEYGFEFKRYPAVPKIIIYLISILYLSMFISVIFSNYFYIGMEFIFRTTFFFVLIYLFYALIGTQQKIRLTLNVIAISGFILINGIIIDFLLKGRNLSYLFQPIRDVSYGIYGNINITGSYAIIIFPMIITAFYIFSSRLMKIIVFFSALLVIVNVLLLASRAALAGIILGSGIILFYLNKKIFNYFVSIIIVVVLVYLIFTPFGPSFDYALRLHGGLSEHDKYWELAIDMFDSNPLHGIGLGAYPSEEFNYIPVLLDSFVGQGMIAIHNLTENSRSNDSHNFYLVMATDMGIPGLIFAFSLLFVFYKILYQVYQKYSKVNKEIKLILILILAVGINLTLRGLVESAGLFYYGSISTDLPFWLFFVILISYNENRIDLPVEQ